MNRELGVCFYLLALIEVDGALQLPLALVGVVVQDELPLRRLLQHEPPSPPSLQKNGGNKACASSVEKMQQSNILAGRRWIERNATVSIHFLPR